MEKVKIFLVLIFLAGCMTEKKANNYFNKNPVKLALKCSVNFPCVTKDSTVKQVTNDSEYEIALEKVQLELEQSYVIQDSLSKLLLNDTLCNQYVQAIERLKQKNKELQGKASHLPPIMVNTVITKTIDDSAKLKILYSEIDRLKFDSLKTHALLAANDQQLQSLRKSIRGKLLIPYWILFVLGVAVGLIIFGKRIF